MNAEERTISLLGPLLPIAFATIIAGVVGFYRSGNHGDLVLALMVLAAIAVVIFLSTYVLSLARPSRVRRPFVFLATLPFLTVMALAAFFAYGIVRG